MATENGSGKDSKYPTRQSLLRAAQDHYSKKATQKSELEMSPSLMKSSKISQSYKHDVSYYDRSKDQVDADYLHSQAYRKLQDTLGSSKLHAKSHRPEITK
jgi:hypothetical protein